MRFSTLLFAASALVAPAIAQTWTDCNPLNKTCPDNPALGMHHNFVFNKSSTVTDSFNITRAPIEYGDNGAEFTIKKRKDSPTIQSFFYIFFGSVSVVMKAAPGKGVISSIVLQSEDLDEIDWEFMGGNATHAETNYFGKGNTTSFDRAIYYPVEKDVRENFHNYTIDWTAERLIWMIDGKVIRTLPFGEAYGGKNYPQTPVTVRLGIWAGGDPDFPQGTIDWAGGLTDFSKGPYTMYVKSADVKDYSTGKAYHWADRSGSWQSIKSIAYVNRSLSIPLSMNEYLTVQIVVTLLPPRKSSSPKNPTFQSPRNSKPFPKTQRWVSISAPAPERPSSSLYSSSFVSAGALPAAKSATLIIRRSRKSGKTPMPIRLSYGRRVWAGGITGSLRTKAMMP